MVSRILLVLCLLIVVHVSTQPFGNPIHGSSNADTIVSSEPDRSKSMEGRKRALIVAIGNYPNPRTLGYPSIHADNDVPLMRSALTNHGFDIETELINQQASRNAILDALNKFASGTRPGDVVLFHYSGHGDQITDNNGEELDGYDEVLVPFGAPAKKYFKTEADLAAYSGDRHIRDDDLGLIVRTLRERAGAEGNVIFWLDSCYSGTGTRGPADGPQARGVDEPIGRPAVTRGQGQESEAGGLFEPSGSQARSGSEGKLAPFIVFSGASHNEKNYETPDENQDGKIVGSLSLALNLALAKLQPGDTYDLLFDEVKKIMSKRVPHQMPQIEGDRNVEVFSGNVVEQDPSYDVEQVIDSGRIAIEGGSFTGLLKGARVALYPKRVQTLLGADTEPWGTGIITTARPTMSVVTLDRELSEEVDPLQGHVFVTEEAMGELSLDIQLSSRIPGEIRAALADMTSGVSAFSLGQERTDLLIDQQPGRFYSRTQGGDFLYLLTPADSIPVAPAVSIQEDISATVSDIESQLLNYARNQYLKDLELNHPEISANLEIVPATHIMDDFGYVERSDTSRSEAKEVGGSWHFAAHQLDESATEMDGYLLRVTNTGTKGAYVSVLDLTPNGCISAILPLDGYYSQEETYIGAGESFLFSELPLVADPAYGYGLETLKLFATTEALDVTPLITTCDQVTRAGTRSGQTSGNLTGLARLLSDADSGTRSPVPKSRGFGSTSSVVFRVVQPD